MNEAKYASLSSGLLARKGAAKPAMRPQAFGQIGPSGLDDLGWNDMGQAAPVEEIYAAPLPEHVPSSISALTPSPKPHRPEPEAGEEAEQPPVAAQQRAIAESFDAEQAAEDPPEDEGLGETAAAPKASRRRAPAEVVALPQRAAIAAVGGRKAAFTLRLDAERHLRLRLACAVTGRSAQQIVTGALDQMLASIPEIESLAERVPASGGKRS